MPNKRLKTITFPGLDNTYTLPDEAPEYSSSSTYGVGDFVVYNGSLYKCTTAISTAEAWTAAHWSETKMGNEVSGLQTAITDKLPINYCDGVSITPNKMIYVKTGATSNSSVLSATDYIDISGINEIIYSRIYLGDTGNAGVAFYDSTKTFITNSGLRGVSGATTNGYILSSAIVPTNAKYIRMSTVTASTEQIYLYDAEEYKEKNLTFDILLNTFDSFSVNVGNLSIEQKYIDMTSETIKSSTTQPKRLVICPVENSMNITVKCTEATSTKRYGFCNSIEASAVVNGATEVAGAIDVSLTNYENYKYFVMQLFLNNDAQKDSDAYIPTLSITKSSAVDFAARSAMDTSTKFFVPQNLLGLPILNSLSDISITTSAFADCAAFHALVKSQLCDNSNGYLTQTLLGNDGHGNNLYMYHATPKSIYYGADRRDGTPDYPIANGRKAKTFRVILTSNIHGIEHNGNWVVYNLLSKIINGNTDEVVRFFRESVEIIWIPYICASGDYENEDGININRDFPTTASGTCVSNEATLVKGVLDQYAPEADLHLDIHTFNSSGTYASYYASWLFTDSALLGYKGLKTVQSVIERYRLKYDTNVFFDKEIVSGPNIATTCTYYTQTVYGVPAGTIEGALVVDGSPESADTHTMATAYLYDLVTQTCATIAHELTI